jgi:hypothetical protein
LIVALLGFVLLVKNCCFAPKYATPSVPTPEAFMELTPAQTKELTAGKPPHQKVSQQTCDPSEVGVKSSRTLGRQISFKDISSVTAEPTRGWDEQATTTKIVFV